MIFKQIYLTIDETLKGLDTSGQSGPEINGIKMILHTSQSYRTCASPPTTV